MVLTGAVDDHAAACDAVLVPPRRPPEVELVLLDLDHTVWDWTARWAAATRGLLRLFRDVGVDVPAALDAVRRCHVRHGTMEHAHAVRALAALPCPRVTRETVAAAQRIADASWRQSPLLPSVRQTLQQIARRGTCIVAFTESTLDGAVERLKISAIDEAVHLVISTSTHPSRSQSRERGSAPWWPKGSPASVGAITRLLGVTPERTVVVGDHRDKDVEAGVAAGCRAVWARYGTVRHPRDQALVDATCHWSVSEPAPRQVFTPVPAIDRFSDLFRWIDPVRGGAVRPSW